MIIKFLEKLKKKPKKNQPNNKMEVISHSGTKSWIKKNLIQVLLQKERQILLMESMETQADCHACSCISIQIRKLRVMQFL